MDDNIYIKVRYRGRLKNTEDLPKIISETEDICKTNGWTHRIWDKDWDQPSTVNLALENGALHFDGHAALKGITLSVGDTELIWLTFTRDGLLQSLFTLADPTYFLNDDKFPWQRVKTGYNGGKTHIALCKLFRYLANKYFERFEVMDESGYWQHQDDDRFLQWINDYKHNHQLFSEELEAINEDDSLSKEEKRKRTYELYGEYKEKFMRGDLDF
ncbi:MAG: hypothetical protein AAF960_29055 [Bacteroidota bacterium]